MVLAVIIGRLLYFLISHTFVWMLLLRISIQLHWDLLTCFLALFCCSLLFIFVSHSLLCLHYISTYTDFLIASVQRDPLPLCVITFWANVSIASFIEVSLHNITPHSSSCSDPTILFHCRLVISWKKLRVTNAIFSIDISDGLIISYACAYSTLLPC